MSRYKVAPLVSPQGSGAGTGRSLMNIGGGHARRLLWSSDNTSSHALPTSLPSKQVPLFRHATRLAPDHFEPNCHVVVVRHLYQYRELQLFRAECDQSSLGDHPEYYRYLPNPWDLDRQPRARMGTSGLAILVTPGRWFRYARV